MTLKVKKPTNKPTSDEPGDIQAAGGNRLLGGTNSPQSSAAVNRRVVAVSPTNETSSVNAKGGLKGAISSRMYGKKLKVTSAK